MLIDIPVVAGKYAYIRGCLARRMLKVSLSHSEIRGRPAPATGRQDKKYELGVTSDGLVMCAAWAVDVRQNLRGPGAGIRAPSPPHTLHPVYLLSNETYAYSRNTVR